MSAQTERLRERIRQQLRAKEKGAQAGVRAWALLIQSRSMRLVPVHHGFLRASAYVSELTPNKYEIGFSAHYALAVHENIEMKWEGKPRRDGTGYYWGPNGQAKFLEQPWRESEREGLRLVKSYMEKS